MSISIKHQMPSATVVRSAGMKKGAGFRLWWQSVIRSWQRRKMIAVLSALDDRILQDIGMHRGEIERVVDGFDDRELRMTPVAPESKPIDLVYAEFRRAA
ncbi:DUF1127 domain-containing protein [Cypionkella psychrotolerans]|uniref:DUF1127 domain-containing protein n=1 Tax=Cypionkella psychrotolerans TaxID=1678131 RepID=UPI0006B44F8E|nr:DUF1127 domain-containing protein [Cypionkella psychrotolerans]